MKSLEIQTDNTDKESTEYTRNNTFQVEKVRCYVRENMYLSNPKVFREHLSIDKKVKLMENLINFPSLATENTKRYLKNKKMK